MDASYIIASKRNNFYNSRRIIGIKINILGSRSILTIKQGMTSDRPDMETIISLQSIVVPAKTFLVPITSGFYVSLRGSFNYESALALVYTTFSYMS